MSSVKEAHAYRVKILAQLLRQIIGESSAIVHLRSSIASDFGVNQVLPSGELVHGPQRSSKKSRIDVHDQNIFCGREFLAKSHEEAVELQVRPMQDAYSLERLDTQLYGQQLSGSDLQTSDKLGFVLGPNGCIPALSGQRCYLKYLLDFDDFEDLALSARMPTTLIEDMAATINMSPSMKTKMSKLRGDASEFLAEARRRLSASSARGTWDALSRPSILPETKPKAT